MGIIETIALIAGGIAALLGLGSLYKSEVKKNSRLETENESIKETVKAAVKQQNVFVLSEKEEQEAIDDGVADLKQKIEEVKKDEKPTDIDTLVDMFNGNGMRDNSKK